MFTRRKLSLLALTAFAVAAINTAHASTVTDDLTLNVTGLAVDPFTASFNLTFDPTQSYQNVSAITLNSSSVPLTNPFTFSYSPVGGGSYSFLSVRNDLAGSSPDYLKFGLAFPTNDITGSGDILADTGFGVGDAVVLYKDAVQSVSQTGTYTVSQVSAVPLPGSVGMFGTALLGLGLFSRRQRPQNTQRFA